MDLAYISAFVGLAGAAIGGLASFSTAWLTQRAQLQNRRMESEKQLRLGLFDQFITESTRLYLDALTHEKEDFADLVNLSAIAGRLRLISTQPVIDAAEETMRQIVETYLAPNKTLLELNVLAKTGELNFMLDFSSACRTELQSIR